MSVFRESKVENPFPGTHCLQAAPCLRCVWCPEVPWMFPVSKGDTVFHSVLQRCSKLQSPISQKRTGAMKNICQNLLIYTQQCSCHSPLQEEAVCVCLDTQWCLSLGCPTDRSPHKNTGVGCRALFQRIFPAQGSNPGLLSLLHWQAGSLALVLPGKPFRRKLVSRKSVLGAHSSLF